jgi:hypothetical protein|tara:strand:- start:474 stop:749 length:276 start_codon:yes stop_codon:yes gene_type:complete
MEKVNDMRAESINNKIHYSGEGYEFTLSDEKYHKHQTFIVRPKHIKVLKNETELDSRDLKENIIEEWFFEENEATRINNNKKRQKNENSKA